MQTRGQYLEYFQINYSEKLITIRKLCPIINSIYNIINRYNIKYNIHVLL